MGAAEADTYPAQITFLQSNYAQRFLEAMRLDQRQREAPLWFMEILPTMALLFSR
tara:strand:- start:139 stop:303 length:165 start_codon:yes stop_codon:yes gene_type:complete